MRNQAKAKVKLLSKDGGFVFTPIHSIEAEVQADNKIAAFGETNKFMSKF